MGLARAALPIDDYLPQITRALDHHPVLILEAPPGSGKTTRVAPALLGASPAAAAETSRPGEILLLQPRRVAARSAALRIAQECGWQVGREIGYQVRFENRTGPQTRLIVATEGILLRRLQSDPLLESVSHVVLDEFHERSLLADVILGMLCRLRQTFRPDLRLIIMSATLATDELQRFLDPAPVIRAEGQLYPVEIRYRPPRIAAQWLESMADLLLQLSQDAAGDVLAFLPGVGEIHRLLKMLAGLERDWDLRPLHGSLPLEQQVATLTAGSRPRMVLATNVAETSLTLEGIRTVVDSGWARILRFDPSVGLDRLELEPICQASATQRAGRAGRLAAGTCYRLWDGAAQRSRPEQLEPEVARVDLAGAVLQLRAWGERPEEFPWLTPPRPEALAAGENLLRLLGAVRDGQVTALGRELVRLPLAPRLAKLLVCGRQRGCLEAAALSAALLSERDPFLRGSWQSEKPRSTAPRDRAVARWNCDLSERVSALNEYFRQGTSQSSLGEIHRGAAGAIRESARQLLDSLQAEFDPAGVEESHPEALPHCLLQAFPDRLARRRAPQDPRGLMVGGRGVRLDPRSGVTQAELFLCIDVADSGTEATVRQACGIERDWLPDSQVNVREELFFHPTQKQVVARRRESWGDLLLAEHSVPIRDLPAAEALLAAEAGRQLEQVLPRDREPTDSFRNRIEFLRHWMPELEWRACDDRLLQDVLVDLSRGCRSFAELQDGPWLDWIRSRYSPEQLQKLDREAPDRIEVPSGSRLKLEYSSSKPPVLAVRIQEIFTWRVTPRVAAGRVPILLHLLAPNFRPQQITDDLASFWANTYETVRRELKRRYPKHAWPDDPLTAPPVKKG